MNKVCVMGLSALVCWSGAQVLAQEVPPAEATGAVLVRAMPESKNSREGPALDVPSGAAPLFIEFDDDAIWGNKRIDPTMQCARNGGDKPASPKFRVRSVPAGASSLVVYVLNEPPSWDNHGLFRVRPPANQSADASTWVVPAISNNRDTAKLPQRITLYAGGNSWGKAYSSPCPSGGSWRYTISVYALDANDGVIGYGKTVMGFAP